MEERRSVIMELIARAKGNLAAPFQLLRDESKQTDQTMKQFAQNQQQSMTKIAGSTATELRKADRGVSQLSHGFQGLTMNLMMASGALQQTGGHMGKMAEHVNKAVGFIALFHAGVLTFRGGASVFAALSAGLSKFTGGAVAAITANAALAASHREAAAAANEQAIAEAAAGDASNAGAMAGFEANLAKGMAARSAATSRRMGYAGAAIGASLGGGAGYLAADRMGMGPWAQVGMTAGGTAVGAGVGKYLGGGAAGTAALAGAKYALPAAIGAGIGYAADAWSGGQANRLYGMEPFGKPALSPLEFAQNLATRPQQLREWWDTSEENEQRGPKLEKQEKARREREARSEARLAIEAPAREQARQRRESMAQLSSGYEAERLGRGWAGEIEQESKSQAGSFLKRFQEAGGEANQDRGMATYLREQRERMESMAESHGERVAEAAKDVYSAEQEKARAMKEQADVAQKLRDFAKSGNTDGAIKRDLDKQALDASQRLMDAELKRVEALRRQGQVTIANLKETKQLAIESEKAARAVKEKELDKRKDLAAEFGAMDPARRKALLAVAEKLKAGRGQDKQPQWRMVGGRPVMVPGSAGALSPEERRMAEGSGFTRDLLRKQDEEAGEKTPEFKRLLELSGSNQRLAAANEQIKIAVESKAEFQHLVDFNTESITDSFRKAFEPKIKEMMQQVEKDMKTVVDQEVGKAMERLGREGRPNAGAG